MTNKSRPVRYEIRLSEAEAHYLNEKYKLSGLKSKSSFIRQLILYSNIYTVDYNELREINIQLAHIGNNLNQIARRANENQLIGNNDLKEAREIMEKVWLTQKSILSNQPSIKQ